MVHGEKIKKRLFQQPAKTNEAVECPELSAFVRMQLGLQFKRWVVRGEERHLPVTEPVPCKAGPVRVIEKGEHELPPPQEPEAALCGAHLAEAFHPVSPDVSACHDDRHGLTRVDKGRYAGG